MVASMMTAVLVALGVELQKCSGGLRAAWNRPAVKQPLLLLLATGKVVVVDARRTGGRD